MRTYNGYHLEIERIIRELFRVTKDGGIVVWVISDQTKNGSESGTSFKQALKFMEVGFRLLDTMIYTKPPRGATGNNKLYWQAFEFMFVFSKGKPKTINLIRDRRNKESRIGDRGTKRLTNGVLKKVTRGGYGHFGRRTNVWEYLVGRNHSSKDSEAYQHPAIFPEQLAHDHIISWSNPGDLIFDCFMGSGTTAKMALLSNRNFVGSEISKLYCSITNKRVEKYKR
jgi:site-specific DNA-methyltransferase (adenine-specific)